MLIERLRKGMKHKLELAFTVVAFSLTASYVSADWRIETAPPGAQVIYDGRNLGPAPVSVPSAHGHTFSAILPGYVLQSVQFKGPVGNRIVTLRLKSDSSAPGPLFPGPSMPSPLGERDR